MVEREAGRAKTAIATFKISESLARPAPQTEVLPRVRSANYHKQTTNCLVTHAPCIKVGRKPIVKSQEPAGTGKTGQTKREEKAGITPSKVHVPNVPQGVADPCPPWPIRIPQFVSDISDAM